MVKGMRTVLDKIDPVWTPKAMQVYREHRASVARGEALHPPATVRVAAVEIAQRLNSAWVMACCVRAAIDGKNGRSEFDINRYVLPTDLASKPKAKAKK